MTEATKAITLALRPSLRREYLIERVGYSPCSPLNPYSLRIGSKVFFSADTNDLVYKAMKWAAGAELRKQRRSKS